MAKLGKSWFPSFISKILTLKAPIDETEATQQDSSTRSSPLECQKDSKFIQLPDDIILPVMDHLQTGDKVNFIKTCRYLRILLEVTLYIHLCPIEMWGENRTTLLHQTLVDRPDLIPYIRSYRGLLLPTPYRTPIQPLPKRTLLDRLLQRKRVEPYIPSLRPIPETEAFKSAVFIFTRATNIVELDLVDYPDWTSNPIFEPIKTAVSKMSITRLTIWSCAEPVEILREQPELKHLEIGWDVRWSNGLKTTDIPKLTSLTATLKDASYIVPGRPIEHFHLVSDFRDEGINEGLFKSLALSTRTINTFSMFLYRPWDTIRVRSILQVVARNLPDIEEMIITVAGTISGRVVLDEIPSFKSLRRLAFYSANLATPSEEAFFPLDGQADSSQGTEIVQQPLVIRSWDDLFTRLKELCPTLVDVQQTSPLFTFSCGSVS